jgi:hypothetical protein
MHHPQEEKARILSAIKSMTIRQCIKKIEADRLVEPSFFQFAQQCYIFALRTFNVDSAEKPSFRDVAPE